MAMLPAVNWYPARRAAMRLRPGERAYRRYAGTVERLDNGVDPLPVQGIENRVAPNTIGIRRGDQYAVSRRSRRAANSSPKASTRVHNPSRITDKAAADGKSSPVSEMRL